MEGSKKINSSSRNDDSKTKSMNAASKECRECKKLNRPNAKHKILCAECKNKTNIEEQKLDTETPESPNEKLINIKNNIETIMNAGKDDNIAVVSAKAQLVEEQPPIPIPVPAPAPLPISETRSEIQVEKREFVEGVEPLCLTHEKQIEAFCQEDNELVCISCILSNEHKGHTLHSIEKAIDLQITYIGKEYEKSKEIKTGILKQKKEIQEKLESFVDSLNSRKKDVSKFFDEIKQIINEKEAKMLEEVDEKFKQNNGVLQSKIELLSLQEESVLQLEDMMNIHIEENLSSKLNFLNNCRERSEIIDKANKQVIQIKYPAPINKFNNDKELESLVKELKQKPKAAHRKASVNKGNQDVVSSLSHKGAQNPNEHFNKSNKQKNSRVPVPKTPDEKHFNSQKSPEAILREKDADKEERKDAKEKYNQTFKVTPEKPLSKSLKKQVTSKNPSENKNEAANRKEKTSEVESTKTPSEGIEANSQIEDDDLARELQQTPVKSSDSYSQSYENKLNEPKVHQIVSRRYPGRESSDSSSKKQQRNSSATRKKWDKKKNESSKYHKY